MSSQYGGVLRPSGFLLHLREASYHGGVRLGKIGSRNEDVSWKQDNSGWNYSCFREVCISVIGLDPSESGRSLDKVLLGEW